MFTLLLHWKRKLWTRQCSYIDTDLMIKENCNLVQSLPLCCEKTWTHEHFFLFHASGHFWDWPCVVIFVPYAGFCHSNLVVGFLIAPSRHGYIKYFVSIGIIYCQSFVNRWVLSFCDKFPSFFSPVYYGTSPWPFSSGSITLPAQATL